MGQAFESLRNHKKEITIVVSFFVVYHWAYAKHLTVSCMILHLIGITKRVIEIILLGLCRQLHFSYRHKLFFTPFFPIYKKFVIEVYEHLYSRKIAQLSPFISNNQVLKMINICTKFPNVDTEFPDIITTIIFSIYICITVLQISEKKNVEYCLFCLCVMDSSQAWEESIFLFYIDLLI